MGTMSNAKEFDPADPVVALIARKMDEAAQSLLRSTMLEPPFCDVDLHRVDVAGMVYICRDCGEIMERKPDAQR